jgi:hypothetical protein
MLMDMHGRTKQRLNATAVQIGTILGLEIMLQAAGLILTCPSCADDGSPQLETDNSPTAREWKIDCGCRERRLAREDMRGIFDGDGDLMATAEDTLRSLRLTVRCPEVRCVRFPLDVERTEKGTVVRCRCAKTTFRRPSPTQN